MSEMHNECPGHSGVVARINSLEARGRGWDLKLDSIIGKINIILGSIVVSALGIIGLLIVEIVRGQ